MKKDFAAFLLLIALSIILAVDCIADPGIIPVTKFTSPTTAGKIPDGWKLEKKSGQPIMSLEKDGNSFYLHLISLGNSSFGLRKETLIDIKKYPILCWRWKVTRLPRGGDVRKSSTDDQALQVYVAFKEGGFLGLNTPIIGYIWDTEAPKGWSGRSPQTGGDKVRYIVLRNKADKSGEWYTERRNVYQDYKRLFADVTGGEPQGTTTGLQIYINSQRTKSPAESFVGDMYFSDETSDIAFAEKSKELTGERKTIISAIKPVVTAKLSAAKKLSPLNCINVHIEFDTNSSAIDEKFAAELQKVADYLIKNRDVEINIIGHTDNVGNEEYNLALSNRRAESVKAYLIDKFGINPLLLSSHGVGSIKPLAGNDNASGRQQNRRVTISNCPED